MSATLDDVMAELRVVRQLLERQARPQLLPEQRAVVIALAEVLGVSSFSTRDALKLLELDIYARPALRQAFQALVPSLDRQRIGLALGEIVRRGGCADGWRLTRPTSDGGRALWCIEWTGPG